MKEDKKLRDIDIEQLTDCWRQNRVKEVAKKFGLWGLEVGSEEYENAINSLTLDQQKEIDDIYKPMKWVDCDDESVLDCLD